MDYKIAVHILASNGVSPVLRVIAKDVLGLGNSVDALGRKFGQMRLAALGVGAAVGTIGAAAAGGAVKIALMGDALVRTQQQMRMMGMSAGQVQSATSAAIAAQMRYPVVGANAALQAESKLFSVFNNAREARQALPSSIAAEAVLTNLGLSGPTSLNYLAKLVENRGGLISNGQLNVGAYASELTSVLKVLVAEAGAGHALITPAQLYQATRLSGGGAAMVNPFAFATMYAEGVQQLGPTFGRGINQFFKKISGGMMGRTYLENLTSVGLVKPGGIQWFPGSSQGSIKPGALAGGDLATSDTVAWVQNVLLPTLRSHGYVTQRQQLGEVYKLFGDATSTRDIANILINLPSYLRTRTRMEQMPGTTDDLLSLQMQALEPSLKALRESFQSLTAVFGAGAVPAVVAQVHGLTNAMIALESWVVAQPDQTKRIVLGLENVGIALGVLGSAAIVGALADMIGPAGMLIGLAGGIMYLAGGFNAFPLDKLYKIAGALYGGAIGARVGSVFGPVGTGVGAVVGAGVGWWGAGQLSSGAKAIGKQASAAFPLPDILLKPWATQAGVSTETLRKIIMAESGAHPGIVSKTGAVGLMQVMPDTAKALKFDPALLTDPIYNLRVGSTYLGQMLGQFHGNLPEALAAYNWGPGNVQADIAAHGVAWMKYLPDETRGYLAKMAPANAPRMSAPTVSGPVPVVITGGSVAVSNGRDLAAGVTAVQAKELQRNPAGPTGHNPARGFFPPGMSQTPILLP